jgi:hypothetical protein
MRNAMKSEVFYYEWTYGDGQADTEVTKRSDCKVTREFVEERKKNNMLGSRYRIIEESKELVESSAVVDGKYCP